MAEYAVKQLYLPEGSDWNRAVAQVKRSAVEHGPVLIWHGDGLLAFVVADPERNLMDDRWIAALLRAAADVIVERTTLEGAP